VRADGLYHGIVVWGVNWLIFAWLTTTAMGYLVGGLFTALGTTVQAITSGVGDVTAAAMAQAPGAISISTDELKKQVQSVLQSTGKTELQPGAMKQDADRLKSDANSGQSPEQMTNAALTELQQKLAALDRDAAISVMVSKLGMSEAQARQLVQTTIGIAGPLKQQAQEVKQQSVEKGTAAMSRVGTIAMWLFVLALVTLGLSAAGGMVGTVEEGALETHGTSYTTDIRKGMPRPATV
jgi:polyhydroxyalkanoate synthesis regulator phasin